MKRHRPRSPKRHTAAPAAKRRRPGVAAAVKKHKSRKPAAAAAAALDGPKSEPEALDAIARMTGKEVLYALQPVGQPDSYATDLAKHPMGRPTTTSLAQALTWRDRTGPNQHLRRRPDMQGAFITTRLEIDRRPMPNSAAAREARAAAAPATASA